MSGEKRLNGKTTSLGRQYYKYGYQKKIEVPSSIISDNAWLSGLPPGLPLGPGAGLSFGLFKKKYSFTGSPFKMQTSTAQVRGHWGITPKYCGCTIPLPTDPWGHFLLWKIQSVTLIYKPVSTTPSRGHSKNQSFFPPKVQKVFLDT